VRRRALHRRNAHRARGDNFGPFITGAQGAVLFEVMMGDPRWFRAHQDQWERLLEESGMERLPNPPIDLPDWLADARN
jgi:hypothetical protein